LTETSADTDSLKLNVMFCPLHNTKQRTFKIRNFVVNGWIYFTLNLENMFASLLVH